MRFAIVDSPLDVEAVARAVSDDACGAIVTFVGYVRNASEDGRSVVGLEYEAHCELATQEMRAIAQEASERFGFTRIAMAHRIGSLRVGEAAVAVAVAAPHRGAAFAACEYAIDQLKARVPIWKKEHYRNGEARWRENPRP